MQTTVATAFVASFPSCVAWAFPHRRLNFTCPTFCDGNWRNGAVGSRQAVFIEKLQAVKKQFDVQVLYDLSLSPLYVWDHIMPLFHAFPGRIVVGHYLAGCLSARGILAEELVFAEPQEISSFISSGKRRIVFAAGYRTSAEAASKWGLGPHDQIITLRSGNDEDHFWDRGARSPDSDKVGQSARFPPLLFTDYRRMHCRGNVAKIASKLKADRPTVLYLGTRPYSCTDPGFISPAPNQGCNPRWFPSDVVVQGLLYLCKDHNVIIRPHPFDVDNVWRDPALFHSSFPNCVLDDYRDGVSFLDTAQIADIIIGEPSASMASIFHTALRTPALYLLRDWHMYSCVKKHVLNSSAVEVFFPDHASHWQSFLQAVARAKAPITRARERVRRAYFKKYHGDVDGFEDYRLLLSVLRNVAGDDPAMVSAVLDLEGPLSAFSRAPVNVGGVFLPTCDSQCCQWSPKQGMREGDV